MRTVKLCALALSAALALASCGGTTPPKVDANKPAPEQPAEQPGTVKGGTILKPEGSTAANEFIIKGERARALAKALGFTTGSARSVMAGPVIGAQATTDEMRVLLAVTRSKSGENAGRKRAQAIFVWGNDEEKTVAIDKNTYALTLDIFPQADPNTVKRYEGSLEMEVTYPDFQAKATRAGAYVNDTGAMCAKLVYNFTTAPNTATPGYTPLVFNNTSAPLEICEGADERNAERVALEKAALNLDFTAGSLGAAPFGWVSKDGVTVLPTDAATLAAAVGTDPAATVTSQTLAEFMEPLKAMPAGTSETWTTEEKAAASIARKYAALEKQFGYYYREVRVYTVATSASRDDIVILGLNGWGVGGLRTLRFK